MEVILIIAVVLMAYLLGSFPAGYLVGKLSGVNVLRVASGRTGGTNVLRAAGALAGLLTGVLDAGKGLLAVWLAGQITGSPLAESLAGGAVVLGQLHETAASRPQTETPNRGCPPVRRRRFDRSDRSSSPVPRDFHSRRSSGHDDDPGIGALEHVKFNCSVSEACISASNTPPTATPKLD